MNKHIYFIVAFTCLLVGLNYIDAAWTGPATSPAPTNAPNNNVAAPINVGTTDQVKDGGLGVNSLGVFGPSFINSAAPMLQFNDNTLGSRDFWLRGDGSSFYLLADRNSDGAWTGETPWPFHIVAGATSAGDYARFSNKVRAVSYCDETGASCFDATDVANSDAIGVGQTWQDMTSQRDNGIAHRNTTGRPIQVVVVLDDDISCQMHVSNDNVAWIFLGASNAQARESVSAIIPAGGYYRTSCVISVRELR